MRFTGPQTFLPLLSFMVQQPGRAMRAGGRGEGMRWKGQKGDPGQHRLTGASQVPFREADGQRLTLRASRQRRTRVGTDTGSGVPRQLVTPPIRQQRRAK